jgi:hypothetical protein
MGATAKTDGWPAYPGAPGVRHQPHVIGKMAAHVVLPWVHRIFFNRKAWVLGVTGSKVISLRANIALF